MTTMRPEDVPQDLVDDAVDAWHKNTPALLDDELRAVLAAVLPAHRVLVRAEVADEIENLDREGFGSDYDRGLNAAEEIARGGQ